MVNSAWRRLQSRYIWSKLSGGYPEGGPPRLRCLRAWGGAPCPLAPRTARPPLEKHGKGRSPLPVQPTPDTPSAPVRGDPSVATARALLSSYMQADDELTFAVDGLKCKCVSNYRVRVGMNLPSRQRMLITRRVGDDAETTVKRYRDDPATAARFAAAINALRASGVNCAKQFDPVRQIIPSPALPRAAFSHWAYPGMIAHISRRFLQRQW